MLVINEVCKYWLINILRNKYRNKFFFASVAVSYSVDPIMLFGKYAKKIVLNSKIANDRNVWRNGQNTNQWIIHL